MFSTPIMLLSLFFVVASGFIITLWSFKKLEVNSVTVGVNIMSLAANGFIVWSWVLHHVLIL